MSSLQDWQEANQRYLMAEIAVLQRRLESYIAKLRDGTQEVEEKERERNSSLSKKGWKRRS